ncbi:hypothetical protein PUMCH_001144 [Australozyma saopauloensis]|uniref:Aminotransferase class V domain-containing protein n=1 Tax=Australozyma saopauloensis TaxID=291208 RepID=A0AAX4H6A5_9ASCO|nr:hypothetical protein PUMCH_001144 [[Candida] saopauloensis]
MEIEFGHKFRARHFPAINRNGFTSVNHGSYGMVPQVLIEKLNELTNQFYSGPDAYIDEYNVDNYRNALVLMGQLLDCPSTNLTFATGDSVAVNTVLRSFPFEKGDVFVIPNTTYINCKKTFEFLEDSIGIEVVVLDFDLPVTHDTIITEFEKVFKTRRVKMAFFDTVSSIPSVKFPFRELTSLCKEYGVLSFVDGAHGIGLFPIRFQEMQFEPDFFSSNLHKWLHFPYSYTVLYADQKHHKYVQTFPISDTYKNPETVEEYERYFNDKFESQTRASYQKLALIADAIEFRNVACGGEDQIYNYCTNLSKSIKKMVKERWPGVKVISNENDDHLDSAMTSFYVPHEVSSVFAEMQQTQRASHVGKIAKTLVRKHKTFMPLFFFKDRFSFRLSAQIYNELSDYEYAVDSLKSAVEELFNSEENLPNFDELKIES